MFQVISARLEQGRVSQVAVHPRRGGSEGASASGAAVQEPDPVVAARRGGGRGEGGRVPRQEARPEEGVQAGHRRQDRRHQDHGGHRKGEIHSFIKLHKCNFVHSS